MCGRFDLYGDSQLDPFKREGYLRFIDVDLQQGRAARRKMRSDGASRGSAANKVDEALRKHAKSKTQLEEYGLDLMRRILGLDTAAYNLAKDEWKAEAEARVEEEERTAKDWSDTCNICSLGGSLICCDGCFNATHAKCAKLGKQAIPDEWYCCDCEAASADEQEPQQSAVPKASSSSAAPKGGRATRSRA